MQVICTSCGAQYDFDASVIPAEGYDAQCTTCNAIFFVSPPAASLVGENEAAAAPEETLQKEVSVVCTACQAEYRFYLNEIPAEGYDAQCTQCAQIFFVSPEILTARESKEAALPLRLPSEPLPLPEEATPVAPIQAEAARLASEAAILAPQAIELESTVAEAPSPKMLAAATPSPAGGPVAPSTPPAAPQAPAPRPLALEGSLTPDRAHELRQALAPEHGPSRRTRLSVALACLLVCISVVALGVGWGLTVRAPDLRPAAKPQMPIQVIANAPTRQAASSLARGLKQLAPDTDAGYRNARAAFLDAIARDPELVTDAYAASALIDMLSGDDVRREAHRGMVAPDPNALTHSFDALVSGATWLLRGRRVVCQTPLIAAVTAYWYAMSDARTSARTQLEHVAHLTDDPMHTDANRIVPLPVAELRSRAQALALAVAALADARLSETEPNAERRVPEALGRAEAAWPEWRRPRYELAAYLIRVGETDEARAVLERLLLDAPDHGRAKLLLKQLPHKSKEGDRSLSPNKQEGRARARKGRHPSRRHRDRGASAPARMDI